MLHISCACLQPFGYKLAQVPLSQQDSKIRNRILENGSKQVSSDRDSRKVYSSSLADVLGILLHRSCVGG